MKSELELETEERKKSPEELLQEIEQSIDRIQKSTPIRPEKLIDLPKKRKSDRKRRNKTHFTSTKIKKRRQMLKTKRIMS